VVIGGAPAGAPDEDPAAGATGLRVVPPAIPSVGEVVRLALGADVARLVASDPIARIGTDVEGVHQARVATRRLRSHLVTYAPVLRTDEAVRLGKDLRWLGRSLAAARDLDVLRDRVAKAVRAIDPLARDDGLALLQRVDLAREDAATSLESVLASGRYRRLLASLAAMVAAPPFRRSATLPAAPFLHDTLLARYRTVVEAVDALPPAPPDTQLHAVRILAKPARYAAEAGAHVLGAACGRFGRRVTDLCDTLGVLNDGSRVSLWLDTVDPVRASAVARIRAIEIGRMADARADWWRAWDRVRAAAAELGWEADEPAAS
jgi:CHAD domain-containing protein